MPADPRVQTILDYTDSLTDAQTAAIDNGDRDSALALHEQIEKANDLREKTIQLIMRDDDTQLASLKSAVQAENAKLQSFQNKINAIIKDVALAEKIAKNLGKVAKMVGAL